MDKGLRAAARVKFTELNELRRRNEGEFVGAKANTIFRKHVMAHLMEEFGCTLASAATHYNEAFRYVKGLNAELVSGLGRPEDKKGGRKKKSVAAVVEAAPAKILLLGYTPKAAEEVEAAQTEFAVKKKATGEVVAEGLTLEDAKALVNKAAAAKKAKLYWV